MHEILQEVGRAYNRTNAKGVRGDMPVRKFPWLRSGQTAPVLCGNGVQAGVSSRMQGCRVQIAVQEKSSRVWHSLVTVPFCSPSKKYVPSNIRTKAEGSTSQPSSRSPVVLGRRALSFMYVPQNEQT